jgi:hypothetical protein
VSQVFARGGRRGRVDENAAAAGAEDVDDVVGAAAVLFDYAEIRAAPRQPTVGFVIDEVLLPRRIAGSGERCTPAAVLAAALEPRRDGGAVRAALAAVARKPLLFVLGIKAGSFALTRG